jgi:hypothetical protein
VNVDEVKVDPAKEAKKEQPNHGGDGRGEEYFKHSGVKAIKHACKLATG